jgi:hypothetical protein
VVYHWPQLIWIKIFSIVNIWRFPKKDIEALKYLGAKSKQNKEEIKKAIDLYQSRKIERFDTARNIITKLSSKGEINQQTAKDKLKFYEDEYIPRAETLANPIPIGYNRFIKPKTDTPESLAKLTVSELNNKHTKSNEEIKLTFTKHYLNIYGNEIRNVYQLIEPHRKRLLNEVKKNIR